MYLMPTRNIIVATEYVDDETYSSETYVEPVCRTQSNMYDRTFCENSSRLLVWLISRKNSNSTGF